MRHRRQGRRNSARICSEQGVKRGERLFHNRGLYGKGLEKTLFTAEYAGNAEKKSIERGRTTDHPMGKRMSFRNALSFRIFCVLRGSELRFSGLFFLYFI